MLLLREVSEGGVVISSGAVASNLHSEPDKGPQFGLEAKLDTGEWKFVEEDWSDWTPEQRRGHWLRTWNGVKQVLRWLPAEEKHTSGDRD